MLFNFGVGTIIGRRTDQTYPTPDVLGVTQDMSIDIDIQNVELYGQLAYPVDVAQAKRKITGKAKFARFQANLMNDLAFGTSGAITPSAGLQMATNETHTVSATTQTVTQAASFKEDLGVFYVSNGKQLARVAPASEAAGKYSVNETTGVYTFAVADEVALSFYYTYTVTTMNLVTVSNVLMGAGSAFEMYGQESYTNNAGVAQTMLIKLNACRSSKFTIPMKNTEYTIPAFRACG